MRESGELVSSHIEQIREESGTRIAAVDAHGRRQRKKLRDKVAEVEQGLTTLAEHLAGLLGG